MTCCFIFGFKNTKTYFDTVISGPAEVSIPQFMQDFINHEPKPFYRNVDVCACEYKIPARDKITQRKKLRIPAIVADRGCNNACKYCSMRTMWKSNPRPVEKVVVGKGRQDDAGKEVEAMLKSNVIK